MGRVILRYSSSREPLPPLTSALRTAALGLRVDAVTAEVVTAMREAGIRALLLKGPSIATWLYGDAAARPYEDSDLLVAPGSYSQAGDVLWGLGFDHREYLWRRDSQTWLRASETSGGDPYPSCVDLHRSLNGVGASPGTVWEGLALDADTMQVGGIEVEVLRLPARALHVALHAAQHGADAGRPLEDLARAVRVADEPVWRGAADLARRLDALPAFGAGLRLDPDGTRLAERLRLPAERPPEVALRAGPHNQVAIALESLASERSLLARARLLVRALVPSRLYMRHWSATHMTWWPTALRQGSLGLSLAYVWRPIWLLLRLPRAVAALRRARRSQPPDAG